MSTLNAWTDAEGIQRATELFTRTFDRIPTGVWASPGRVNLIGEHVDYNGGLCLPMALPHCTFAAMAPRDDRTIRLISSESGKRLWEGSLDDVFPGADIPKWIAYAAGPVWALMQEPDLAPAITGFDAATTSCVPLGAGLSSSASIECAIALGADGLFNLGLANSDEGRIRIAQAGMRAENEVAGAATGGLDQAASVRTIENHAILLDCLDMSIEHIPFDLSTHGLELLVIDTMAHHALNDGQYASRRGVCEEVARAEGVATLRELPDPNATIDSLEDPIVRRRITHVITEIERVRDAASALRNADFVALGALFNASHASMRDDYEISCPELDCAVDVALECGALGARMTGGGFGGSAIALLPIEDIDKTCHAIEDAFTSQGWRAPRFLNAWAGDSGRRLVSSHDVA